MNCYDCATIGHHSAAVAICIDCGAGMCVDHANVALHHLTRVAPINRIETVEPPARLMYCDACAAAHDAVAHRAAPHHAAAS